MTAVVAQGMAPTESAPAESSYGREISDEDVARFVEDGVRARCVNCHGSCREQCCRLLTVVRASAHSSS